MEEETISINDLFEVLQSLNEFDPVMVAKLMAAYLVLFIMGYSAGTVVKLMKRT